jgi:hypothetical protein
MIDSILFDSIGNLAKTTFTDATSKEHLTKALGEVQEAIDAPKSKRLMEYADVIHCIVAAASRDGYSADDLDAAVWAKLAINRQRTWVKMPDGTYQHSETEPT